MSTTAKHVAEAIKHPSSVMAGIMNHKALAFAITAVLLVAVISTLMLAKNSNQAQAVHNDAITGTTQPSLDTKVKDSQESTQPVSNGGSTVSGSSDNASNSSQSSTNVTVNNQKIDVPQNGTVNKTIESEDGTTTVNISSSTTTSSTNDGSTSKSSSVNINSVSGNAKPSTHMSTNINRYLP